MFGCAGGKVEFVRTKVTSVIADRWPPAAGIFGVACRREYTADHPAHHADRPGSAGGDLPAVRHPGRVPPHRHGHRASGDLRSAGARRGARLRRAAGPDRHSRRGEGGPPRSRPCGREHDRPGSSSSATSAARGGRLHVTLLGSPLAPAAITAIAGRIAASGANIDRIGRLAQRPVTCIEMDVSGGDPAVLRADLARAAAEQGVDVAVQRGGLYRRAMRLIVMDVDSTLIQDEVIDLLAARAGCAAEVAKVTESAMRGDLDFASSLRERVALLAGLEAGVLDEVRDELRLTAGARTLIRTLGGLGYKFGIVSGGF